MAGIIALKDNVKLFIWAANASAALADKIGHVVSIGDIGGEAEQVDVTALDSLAREYELGFTDNGTLEITQNLTDDEYADMTAYQTSGEKFNWGLSVANRAGTQVLGLQGAGIMQNVKLTGIDVSGVIQVVSTIKISGAITQDFTIPNA